MERFGQDVKLYRESRGLRMTDAANDLRKSYGIKIDQSYLSRIESGQVDLKLKHFLAIADYLELDVAQLIASLTAPSGVEYLGEDPYVFRSLLRLKAELGQKEALNTLHRFFELLEKYDKKSPGGADRPTERKKRV